MGRKLIENPNSCSLVHAMNVVGGKWKPIIINLLAFGSLRFGKLAHYMQGVSKKVLTEQLRELEEDGLVQRKKFAEVPPRVEYSLTEKGAALLPVLMMLSEWTMDAFDEIKFEPFKLTNLLQDKSGNS